MSDKIKLRKTALSAEGTVMLGPVDLEDWLDEDEDEDLRARLRQSAEIRLLDENASLKAFPGWTHLDFALARKFSETDYLDSHELRQLAERLGLWAIAPVR